ncbi:DUF4123 domain-containing protein [Massilia sp. TWP1-3-3]|uniref:DUF4123 domain-containing protein n=1 Tax=Massilia sp. TWP1-3-3 TaxID=2804573 RepID=UPI003CF50B04
MNFAGLEATTFESKLAASFDNPDLTCYAIVDAAQDGTLLQKFAKESLSTRSMCLVPAAIESEMEDYSPHLVALSPLAADSDAWAALLGSGAAHPASFTLLTSTLDFDELWANLAEFTEIVLPDETTMIFAFWDPAILGTLVGQKSDKTLHVSVGVLSERQRARLLQGVTAWWYWDRDGYPQEIRPVAGPETAAAHLVSLPLLLSQVQVDMLVEAGVPDQLLALLHENQPLLLERIPMEQRYRRVEKHLLEARRTKLFGMRDILNYTCAALIYGEAVHSDPEILSLLARVKEGEIAFDDAIPLFPGREESPW